MPSFRTACLTMLIALLLVAPLARAQEQTGTIEGVVRDAQGLVLPGATVQVRNVAVGATLEAVADPRGSFRLPALAPGSYNVTATLTGFQSGRFEQVEVMLGEIKHLDFSLAVGGLTETVEVSGASPLVDVKQSARGSNLRHEQLDLLPRRADYTSVIQLLPGANAEPKLGGISIDGASAAENRFIVDGVDTTNAVNGLSGMYRMPTEDNTSLPVDSVEELQVKSSGYAAEYGGSTGGVVNVLTRSGSNTWHGDARLYFSGAALDAGPRPTLRRKPTAVNEAEYITYPEDPYVKFQPGVSIGGPLRRDVAWFFLNYQPRWDKAKRTVTFTLDNTTRTVEARARQQLVTASQTMQPSSSVRTRLSLNASPWHGDGVLPSQAGNDSPDSNFDVVSDLPNWTLSGTVDVLPTPNVQFSARLGYTYQNSFSHNVTTAPKYNFGVTNIGMPGVPAEYQRVNGYTNESYNYTFLKDRVSRLVSQVDATWYVRGWGEHAFKAGVQGTWTGNDTDQGYSNIVTLQWNRAYQGQRGTYGYYSVASNPLTPRMGRIIIGKAEGATGGLFIQDAWRVGARLTVNAGLRTETEILPSYSQTGATGPPAVTFGFGQKLAPRLGAAYDLLGDGRWKLYGSWGVFYDIFKYSLAQSFNAWFSDAYVFTLDTYDWPTLLQDPACPPSCPGRRIRYSTGYTNETVPFDPNLEPMKSQEAAVGVEHQLRPNLVLSARYVHKQLDRAVEDIAALNKDFDPVYTVGNPGYGVADFAYTGVRLPKAVRDYDGVEVAARRTMSRNWALNVSYVWSRLWGNYSGLSQSDENGRVSPNIGAAFDTGMLMFDQHASPVLGPLATDRPHQFKAQVVYQARFGLSVGAFLFAASGLPVTRQVQVYNNGPVMYRGRLSDGRTPALSQTDLNVQQELGAWGRARLSLGLTVTNLFNQGTAISRHSTEMLQGYAFLVSDADFYAGQVDFNQLFVQQSVPRDARFLMPNDFQAPRTARLMAKLAF